ncbi:MAG: ADP-ribosylglycohydrolase family protein [Cyanobacteria bacterium SIG27]|nr:ADP-ribosylglycohydrolase family protein [Cyanobacteria bacterium SIG27]
MQVSFLKNNLKQFHLVDNKTANNKKCTNTALSINLSNDPLSIYNRSLINFSSRQKEILIPEKRFEGCLLGGAIGDALGAPIEFSKYIGIQKEFGKKGVQGFESFQGFKTDITDDTQMTMFTADGLISSSDTQNEEIILKHIFESYKKWIITQESKNIPKNTKGWLANNDKLYSRRSPGVTCISSIKSGAYGSMECPINDKKGSGGLMRVAPIGLKYYKDPEFAFKIACKCAAMTHGNPDGFLPAGVFAGIIAYLTQGEDLNTAILKASEILIKYKNHQNTLEKITFAKQQLDIDSKDPFAIAKIGKGWVADEALGIAIYCALKYENDFTNGIIASINHGGDSDTTGAITGNILGAKLGAETIPENWIKNICLSDEIKMLSSDLFKKSDEIEEFDLKY